MTSENKAKKAKSLRQSEVSRISDVHLLAQQAATDTDQRLLFAFQYKEIDNIREEFFKQHNVVIGHIDDDEELFKEQDKIRKSFETSYWFIKTTHFDIFGAQAASGTASSTASSATLSHVTLPKIEIPSFSGNITQFTTFKDMFDALIHQNHSLRNIEKFNYLLSFLKGSPLALVQKLPMTDLNYSVAYDTLVKRYQNTRLVAATHWAAIENAPKLASDSPQQLRQLLDTFADNLAALNNLNFPVDSWDFILVQMLLKRIHVSVATKFELQYDLNTTPTYAQLTTYLNKHCTALDNVCSAQHAVNEKKSVKREENPKYAFLAGDQYQSKLSENCKICNSKHAIYRCPIFLNNSPNERYQLVKSHKLCLNCLSNCHTMKACKSPHVCHKCKQKHHTLLHFERQSPLPVAVTHSPPNQDQSSTVDPPLENSQKLAASGILSNAVDVLLSTAVVEVLDGTGNFQRVRILLDSGSQLHFISQNCVRRLGLSSYNTPFSVQGLAQSTIPNCSKGIFTKMRPFNRTSPNFDIEAVILPQICGNLPHVKFPLGKWSHLPPNLLADPAYNLPAPIDLLIGAPLFPYILQDGRLTGGLNEPVALNTVFGFVLMGKTASSASVVQCRQSFLGLSSSIEQIMEKFWEVEEVPQVKLLSPEEEKCEQLFADTTTRTDSGRFVVSLPFRSFEPTFPNSRDLALCNFLSLERRLEKTPSLYENYSKFIKEYLELGHMELITNDHVNANHFYIPHHCVLKDSSPTTKLRVVFNASAKSAGNLSLNDHLLPGPKLQSDIVKLLLRFRLHRFVFTSDVRQMFRQILVHPKHTDYQRILWRFSKNDPIEDYRLLTVTYGLTCAPYLAIKSLLTLAEQEKINFPAASRLVLTSSYVDDITGGCSTIEGAKALQQELIALLAKGGFELRKWCSNDTRLLVDFPASYLFNENVLNFESDSTLKILGLQWNHSSDVFQFSVSPVGKGCTKRSLLSNLAKIFDPLGILSPVTFLIKHLIQRLWYLKLDWDAIPPPDVLRLWNKYTEEVSALSSCTIPRLLFPNDYSSVELHGFCDSSEKGYCAVVYFCCLLPTGQITTHFVCAKSKVAPLKTVSIPRLELCAAVLLARLLSYVHDIYQSTLSIAKTFAWSDSTITLSWIKSSPHRWTTFVSNRVALIQGKLPTTSWYHVSSENNPADIGSRGLFPTELAGSSLWWAGPNFLLDSRRAWLPFDSGIAEENLPEAKNLCLVVASSSVVFIETLISRYSSLDKLQRVLAYILRFKHNLSFPTTPKQGSLTSFEIQTALMFLVKYVQRQAFSQDLAFIEKNQMPSTFLRKLNPFIDDGNILRVGSRLKHSLLPYNSRFPALLPAHHALTKLVVNYYHLKYFHAGVQSVQFLLAQQFWIISSKRVIRQVLSQCVACFKANPKTLQPPMGDLPVARVSQVKPFFRTGVDYAGPFDILMSRSRGSRTTKAYLCLFVCFATKALHLELVSNLSADAFLAALRRFQARRGRCQHLFSDCGTNFIGAYRQLNSYMAQSGSKEGVTWHFNPPSAPHFGGLWEAGVKSVKTHLSRVVGNQHLTYEELNTVLVQIEAFLNSRPLTPFSNDPNDLTALTPAHFLTLEPLSAPPESDITSVPLGRLDRWQMLSRMHQDFWRRWSREYLHTLHQRSKWNKSAVNIQPGVLVLIKNDLTPPMQWHMGRVLAVHPGSDGVVRVATVRTSTGSLKRPVVKLCPLPLSN